MRTSKRREANLVSKGRASQGLRSARGQLKGNEKSYSEKLCFSDTLKGGSTSEAMEDFTGGLAEMYELSDAPPNLFHILLKVRRTS